MCISFASQWSHIFFPDVIQFPQSYLQNLWIIYFFVMMNRTSNYSRIIHEFYELFPNFTNYLWIFPEFISEYFFCFFIGLRSLEWIILKYSQIIPELFSNHEFFISHNQTQIIHLSLCSQFGFIFSVVWNYGSISFNVVSYQTQIEQERKIKPEKKKKRNKPYQEWRGARKGSGRGVGGRRRGDRKSVV